jgi:lysozyme
MPLKQGQYDALVDWVFNLGAGRLQMSRLLMKVLNAGSYGICTGSADGVGLRGGVKLSGLVTRREAEVKLFTGAKRSK